MSSELENLEEAERFALLEACEHRIFAAGRRGIEVTRAIAKELIYIDKEELFSLRCSSFREYVTRMLRFDYRTAVRWMDIHVTFDALEAAKVPLLPANETQAAELARIPLSQRAKTWRKAVETAEKNEAELTVSFVRNVVDIVQQQ